jgi:hypothetical protein
MAINVQAQIAHDHVYVDATETVTVYSADGTKTAMVVDARRTNRVTTYEAIGGGVVTGTVVTFYLWTEVCAFQPYQGDRIVDVNGIAYRVVESELTTMRTRFDVDTVPEV